MNENKEMSKLELRNYTRENDPMGRRETARAVLDVRRDLEGANLQLRNSLANMAENIKEDIKATDKVNETQVKLDELESKLVLVENVISNLDNYAGKMAEVNIDGKSIFVANILIFRDHLLQMKSIYLTIKEMYQGLKLDLEEEKEKIYDHQKRIADFMSKLKDPSEIIAEYYDSVKVESEIE